MKTIELSAISILCILICSCTTLKPPQIVKNEAIENYKYFFISPTSSVNSDSGHGFSEQYHASSKSVNPSEIVTGTLTKEGYIRLPELKPELSDQTAIVNYGESGRRDLGLNGNSIEVTIQFISAKSHTLICSCTAEGSGDTEADDVRDAIARCLSAILPKDN